jgi:diguanylate cyclase (GGDEF)-like protein
MLRREALSPGSTGENAPENPRFLPVSRRWFSKEAFMHSIRTKITLITLIAILVSVLSVGGVGIYSIQKEGNRSSNEEMSLICENLTMSMEEYLGSVAQSVDMISRYAEADFDRTGLEDMGLSQALDHGELNESKLGDKERKQLERTLSRNVAAVDNLFHSVASHTNGVMAYYYRLNPALSDGTAGFFYAKIANAAFVSQSLTDLSLYDQDDKEHVGWYYIPQERGKPSWLSPYYNENVGVRMISYVAPLYKSGLFLGVIGMDISYDTLVRQVMNERIYKSGYACLLEGDGTIIYHPSLPAGENVSELFEVDDINLNASHSRTLIPVNTGSEEKRMAFSTLSNGMKLVVTAPLSEINASWTQLIDVIFLTSLIILLIFATVMAVSLRRITDPLRRLTEASKHISDGDYDVELSYDGDDELGILTRSFQQLVSHLKIYIKDLNSKAYRDALTGVKNKGAFDISAHKLDDMIRMAEPGRAPQFAVVMLDCNDLKSINDQLGHDKGDIYLCAACTFICGIFVHSPVFRLGGDEFAVILQKHDYEHREELLKRFRQDAQEANAGVENPWEQINIALGMAVYDSELDKDVSAVLHRADERMYADKRRMKADKKR